MKWVLKYRYWYHLKVPDGTMVGVGETLLILPKFGEMGTAVHTAVHTAVPR